MTNQKTKIKFTGIRSWSDFKEWWNKQVVLRVKGIAYTLFVVALLIMGGQFQIAHVNDANIAAVCESRAQQREDLRKVLYSIVDLSDLYPDDDTAEQYTQGRILIINSLLDPEKDKAGCGHE